MRKFSFFLFIVVLVVFSVRPVSAQTAKQLPDSTLIVTEEGDTLVEYSYKAFDFGPIKHPSPEEKISFVMSDWERRQKEEAFFASLKQRSDTSARRIAGRLTRSGLDSYSVGSIPIVDGVSPSGARTYTIPINPAPGYKLTPGVALSYNSQAGEGLVGYGWDISGLSSIRLISKNNYYHGESKAAMDFAADAVFSLDGEPLVTNDNSSQAPFTLVTARSHVLVKAEYNVAGYISRFIALYPDGRRAVFGHGLSVAYNLPSYPVTEITDALGNRVSFVYSVDSTNSNDYITQIRYGYDASGAHHAEINFSYLFQPPAVMKYYACKNQYIHCRLSGIESKDGGTLIYRYSLTYDHTDNIYLLTRVECNNSAGEALPPLEFEYGGQTTPPSSDRIYKQGFPIVLSAAFLPGGHDLVFKRGKFAASDYRDGVLIYPKFEEYDAVSGSTLLNIYKYGSLYPSDQTILLVARMEDYNDVDATLTTGSGFQTIEPVDVDGDGVDEIVKVNLAGTDGSDTVLRITVYKCNDSGVPGQISTFTVKAKGVVTSGTWKSPYRRSYYWGDFNGDGKAQLLAIAFDYNYNTKRDYAQNCYATLIDIAGQRVESDAVQFSYTWNDQNRIIVADIDADSRTELCRASSSNLSVYREQTSGALAFESVTTNSTVSLLSASNRSHCITDLNGDGYADIVITPEYGTDTNWKVLYFKGDCFTASSFSSVAMSAADTFMFLDLDYDGLPDLIRISGTQIGTAHNWDGRTFDSFQVSSSTVTDAKGIVPMNAVNYGASSCFVKFDGFYGYIYSYSRNSAALRHLTASVDSYGVELESNYSYLPSFIWRDSSTPIDASQGYASRVLPVFVLNSEAMYVPGMLTCYRDRLFRYYNGVFHNLGLGFCGFGKTLYIDNYVNAPSIVAENVFAPMKLGMQTARIMHLESTYGFAYHSTENVWDNHSTSYGKLSPRLQYITETDSLTLVRTNTEFAYDTYDYPVLKYVIHRSSGATVQRRLYTWSYNHSVSTNRYLLGSLLQENLRTDLDGDYTRSWKEKSIYMLDSLKRPVDRKDYRGVSIGSPYLFQYELQDSTLLVSETRWTYDAFGNASSEKRAPYDVTEFLGDTLVYDSAGRFLLSRTDALGHTTTYSGYNKYGSPSTVTNYRGRTKIFSYDSWGNLLQTNYADGSVETISREWGGSGVYKDSTSCTGKPSSIAHYDALGRSIRKGNQRFDGQWQWVETDYNNKGLVSRVSLPYRTATSTSTSPSAYFWNTYTYDSYDRVTSIEEASGRETTWSYSGTSTTTVKDGITSTSTTDAAGNVVSVMDAGGTIVYTLRDDGQPASVTAPGDVVTTFSYDGYGRRVGMNDPSVGTRTYSYTWNADGSSSSSQTGPNGTITTARDKYGRITSVEREEEFITTYSYNTFGRLTAEASTNGTSTAYTYDSLERVASIREDVPDGVWLKKDYTYGPGSNISSIRYISQTDTLTTEIYSYAYGHNTEILLPDSTVVFRLISENDLGQPTAISTGGVSRQYGFNSYGLPTSRKMTAVGGTPFQNFSYVFNAATGNLSSRNDSLYAAQENFIYDSLSRLTGASAEVNGTTSTSAFYYAANGNFTSGSGFGTILYGDADDPYKATTLIDTQSNTLAIPRQSLTFDACDRPKSISTTSYQRTSITSFTYNGAGERAVMTRTTIGHGGQYVQRKKFYAGGRYELSNGVELLYLGGDAYSAPMALRRVGMDSIAVYNIGRDYLGSITHVATSDGTLVSEYNYDPWGRLRNPETLVLYSGSDIPDLFLDRGYTGHEYLPWFGLYNMNARLYDPLVGRFLAPDPFVQAPDFTQNFNRYSYCLNNPLKYSDESGEFIFTAAVVVGLSIGTVLGIGAGVWQGFKIAEAKGLTESEKFWTIVGGGLIGGVAGFASGFAGAAVAPALASAGIGGFAAGAMTGAASGWAAGSINGFGMSLLGGSSIGSAFGQMGIQGAAGALSGALIGGVAQGVSSAIKGNNFWTGRNPRFTSTPNHPSLNNTKVNIDSEHIDSPVSDIPDEYRIRAEANDVFSFNQSDLRPQLSVQRPDIMGYDPRLSSQTDIYHNFPRLFDDIIVKSGVPNYRISDNSMFYYLTGSVNGKEGVFTIGINNDGIIYHRFFYPK